jgi:hypothetical protein
MGLRTAFNAIVGAAAIAVFSAGGAGAGGLVGTTCFGQPATIQGTDGNDTLQGTPGNDVIVTGAGDQDIVFAGDGDDLVCGEDGDDYLFGQGGNDSLDGGTGNDAYAGGPGDDRIVDSEGLDLVVFLQAPGAVTASLATGTATGEGNDTFSGIEGLVGGAFNDTLIGDASSFNALGGGPGDDVLDGGEGFDGALFSTGPVTASLAAGTAVGEGNDTLRNMEGLEGTKQDDNFTGDDGTNVLDGRDGSDTLRGAGGTDLLQGDAQNDQSPGNDRLDGGAGDDFLQPSPGIDILDGGAGRLDLVDFSQMPTGVTANLARGTVRGGNAGSPRFANIEGFAGSPHADSLIGDKGPNLLYGADGNDRLSGAGGDDFLSGGAGNDALDGGAGVDYCLDGRGKGCEFSGEPGGTSPAAAQYDSAAMDAAVRAIAGLRAPGLVAPAAPVRPVAEGDNPLLGDASCVGSTSRVARSLASTRVKRRRTSAGPPHKAATKATKPYFDSTDFLPDWLRASPFAVGGAAAVGDLQWQGTLFRYDSKRRAWRPYRRTAVAYGVVDPSGTAVWTTASGAPVDQIGFAVPAGQFAWKAVLRIPGEPVKNDWIEPHTDYGRQGGGVFAPACTFGR